MPRTLKTWGLLYVGIPDERYAVRRAMRDERCRFLPGHAPLLGGGRPLGSGFGRFRPLLDMMRQAAETEALIAAAEVEPPVAALVQRRRATAERVRRYRKRSEDRLSVR